MLDKSGKNTIKYKYFFLILSVCLLLVSHFLQFSFLLDIFVVVNSLLLCKRYIHNNHLFLVSFVMAWSNYSCVMMQEGMLGRELTTYGQYNGTAIAFLGLEILYLHSVLMLVFSPSIESSIPHKKVASYFEGYKIYPSNVLTNLCFVFLIVFILIINIGFALLEYYGIEGISKSMFEYCIILYILGFNLARGNTFKWYVMLILMCVGIAIDLSVRDRIVPLQMMMLMYVIHFQYKFSKRQIAPFFVAGLLLMIFLGNNREEGEINRDAISSSIEYIENNKFTLDTAWSAYFCSLSELDFGQKIGFNEHLSFLKSYVYYIFLGVAYDDPKADIGTYILSEGYKHSFGNVSPLFFYFYLNWFGVILFSALVAYFFRRSINGHSAFAKSQGLFFLTCSFRWYLYGPSSILRGMLIFSLLYIILFRFVLSGKIDKCYAQVVNNTR